jgi:hypothetical protein
VYDVTDLLTLVSRVSYFNNVTSGLAWVNHTWPAFFLRATPTAPPPYRTPVPEQRLRDDVSGDSEAYLQPTLHRLMDAVERNMTDGGRAKLLRRDRLQVHGWWCWFLYKVLVRYERTSLLEHSCGSVVGHNQAVSRSGVSSLRVTRVPPHTPHHQPPVNPFPQAVPNGRATRDACLNNYTFVPFPNPFNSSGCGFGTRDSRYGHLDIGDEDDVTFGEDRYFVLVGASATYAAPISHLH